MKVNHKTENCFEPYQTRARSRQHQEIKVASISLSQQSEGYVTGSKSRQITEITPKVDDQLPSTWEGLDTYKHLLQVNFGTATLFSAFAIGFANFKTNDETYILYQLIHHIDDQYVVDRAKVLLRQNPSKLAPDFMHSISRQLDSSRKQGFMDFVMERK